MSKVVKLRKPRTVYRWVFKNEDGTYRSKNGDVTWKIGEWNHHSRELKAGDSFRFGNWVIKAHDNEYMTVTHDEGNEAVSVWEHGNGWVSHIGCGGSTRTIFPSGKIGEENVNHHRFPGNPLVKKGLML